MTQDEKEFHKALAILAGRCGTELTEFEIAIFDKVLSPHGYRRAIEAIETVFKRRRGRDAMPSAHDLLEIIEPGADQESEAQIVADLIWGRIPKERLDWVKGTAEEQAAILEERFGWAGAEAIRTLGGWPALVREASEANAVGIKAQLKRSVLAHLRRRGPPGQGIRALIPDAVERRGVPCRS